MSETTHSARPGSDLDYPFAARPELGETIEAAPGLNWIRMRLPFIHPAVFLSAPDLRCEFDDVQRTIVNAIDGRRTIADIVLESRSSTFAVSSTLHSLVRSGHVRLVEAGAEKAAKVEEETAPFEEFSEADEVTVLLKRAQTSLKSKEYEKTQRLLKAAENLDTNHTRVRSAIKGAEAVILADLHAQGLHEARVPKIAKPVTEITQMNFTPNEGFILSRINGQWDIGSLIKISPIREPDAMLIFYRLWKNGIIAFE